MSIAIHRVVTGVWRQNGYVVSLPDGSALIVDPGAEAEVYRAYIDENALRPCAIINTHAHYDHIGAVAPLMATYHVPFYLHRGDAALLRQSNLYKRLFESSLNIVIPSGFQDLGEMPPRIDIDGFEIDVIATPGHTKGSSCFQIGDAIFTGDTLMPNGPGRTDLPGGSLPEMKQTIERLSALRDEWTIYPGHGKPVALSSLIGLMDEWLRAA